MADSIETRLRDMGIELPQASAPAANYRPFIVAGAHLFISGQIAQKSDGSFLTGRLGDGLSVEDGREAARLCALHVVAQAKTALGSLDRVLQILRVTGYVQAAPDFTGHPKVVNGASDFLVEAFGDKGRHTRAAVGVASLPLGSAVEVDAIMLVGEA